MLFFCKFSGFDSVGVKKEEDLRTKPIQLLFPRVVKRLVLTIRRKSPTEFGVPNSVVRYKAGKTEIVLN
ncbi:hypothetical protein CUN59_13255 [Cuspidothrix issatschenkoi CHARLIE-1]|uniref:Uncharacterized protein n=1 Tax=Cuspidothrix issatschenkoi CHARLIE-1 TaxID=2052836 RepID=A0A2S6CSV6_9CYAN|nr:hypothetical protein CUN59_13255 [Cuspidothrix issatschenkoi CHARLIE-1]